MKSVRVELDDKSFELLQRQAERLGVDTETAARSALCEHLEEHRDAGESIDEILKRLEIASGLPEVDAVELIREVRGDLDARAERRWE